MCIKTKREKKYSFKVRAYKQWRAKFMELILK